MAAQFLGVGGPVAAVHRQGRLRRSVEADPHGPLGGSSSAVAVHRHGLDLVVAQKQTPLVLFRKP